MQIVDFQGISFIPDSPLNPISMQEVEAVEAVLGFTFPEDYRAFVSTLGIGETEFSLRAWLPQNIRDNHLMEMRDRLSEFWFWDKSPELLTQERAVECVPFFDSSCGDDIIFHPSDRNRWFILQHEADTVAVVHSFQELCALYLDGDDDLPPPYKFDNYG
jgi:SMI1 / KNR4 family (SUKH-1)